MRALARLAVLLLAISQPALAASLPWATAVSPGQQCRTAIADAERAYALPPSLLVAIGMVESGREGPDGHADPWPWSINVEGVDHVYDTKAEAVAGVRAFEASGARSIDVGCLQVNLMYHPEAFASLDDAFDPARNADYAARFLLDLKARAGDWRTATAWYHSANPDLGTPYAAKVMAAWPREAGRSRTVLAGAAPAPRPPFPPLSGNGGTMLGNNAASARIIPAASGTVGMTLAAYRSRAVPITSGPRPLLR